MPIKSILKLEIERVSILDEHGNYDEKLGAGLIPDADIVKLYEAMSSCRYLDEVAFKLQRSGRMEPIRRIWGRKPQAWPLHMS
jgi:TPP-dependent pyruvate/acetoin dehydrogenase alpha subunit